MRRISILAAIAAAMLSCTSVNDNSINVVPYPNDVELKAGTFDAAGAEFHLSEGLDEGTVNIIKAFACQRQGMHYRQQRFTRRLHLHPQP